MDNHDLIEQQETQPERYESNEQLNATRILRPPGTVTKVPPPTSRLTSLIAQNRFKLINPSGSSTAPAAGSTSSNLLRPLHRLQQQQQHANLSHHYPLTSQTLGASSSKINHNNNNIISQSNDLIGDTRGVSQQRQPPSRIASSRPATGLARPTPVRQIQSTAACNVATNHLTYARLPIGSGGSKISTVSRLGSTNGGSLSQLRPPTTPAGGLRAPSPATSISKLAQGPRPRTSTLIRPKSSLAQSSGTAERPKPSPRVRFGATSVGPESRLRPASSGGSPSPAVSSTTNSYEALPSNNNNLVDLSSVEKDVGQIRRLLEQLLVLLQDSANETASSSQSESERGRDSTQPPIDASTRNEAFSIDNGHRQRSHLAGEKGVKTAMLAASEDEDQNRESEYYSPMI